MGTLEAAKKKAAAILARRRCTKKELKDKLAEAGFEPEAQDVLKWAEKYGFVDDLEYARAFIEDAINIKKYGRRRIEQTLRFKGIDRNTIEDALYEFEFNELEALLPMVQKKLDGNFERKNIQKAVRHFAAKGYSFDDIREAVYQITHEDL